MTGNDDFLASTESESTSLTQFVLDDDVKTDIGTLASGQNLAQYAVIARLNTTAEFVEYDPAGANGAATPVGILVHSVDASSAAAAMQYYKGGMFNAAMVVWNAGVTAAQKLIAFDRTPISLRTPGYSG